MTCPCEKVEPGSCDIEAKIIVEGAVLNPTCLKKYFMSENCVKLNKETSELELNFSCFSTQNRTENSNEIELESQGNTLPHFFACNVPAPRSNAVTFFFAILSKRGRFSNSALCISFRLFPIDGQRFSRSAFHFGLNVLIFYSVE